MPLPRRIYQDDSGASGKRHLCAFSRGVRFCSNTPPRFATTQPTPPAYLPTPAGAAADLINPPTRHEDRRNVGLVGPSECALVLSAGLPAPNTQGHHPPLRGATTRAQENTTTTRSHAVRTTVLATFSVLHSQITRARRLHVHHRSKEPRKYYFFCSFFIRRR